MKLEDIGFYTLSDERAKNTSINTPLWRCELILTDKCNFSCPYCRGMREDCQGTMSMKMASSVVGYWGKEKLKNVRFSGGEPLTYKCLNFLVKKAKSLGVERIAISTNGSFPMKKYHELIDNGVNDISISLDACCAAVGDKMSGGVKGSWNTVVDNIRQLSKITYVTVGMVFTEDNIEDCKESVMFADSLGVADIRVIPSAQYNQVLTKLSSLSEDILDKYPILKYRINNVLEGRTARGIKKHDCHRCWLAMDDMAIAGNYHFPCIIYLREQGKPIGKVSENIRKERALWSKNHDTHSDPICRKNCLDVCIDYNNRASELKNIDKIKS